MPRRDNLQGVSFGINVAGKETGKGGIEVRQRARLRANMKGWF